MGRDINLSSNAPASADTLTYPLQMSSISAAQQIGVLLYVLAPHRMQTAENYITVEIDKNQVVATSRETTNP